MKRFISIIIIVFAICFLFSFNCFGEEILRMATSAQIAEAFGMDVVKEFEQKHNIKVKVFICSSDTALQRVINDFSDIACIANRLPATYREQGYVEIPFAKDPLAIIVNDNNPVSSINDKQLKQVYTGQIKNWKDIKGIDSEIYTIIPYTKSALYRNFQYQVMGDLPISWDFQTYLSIDVVTLVSKLNNAIGFISSGSLKDKKGIKILKINDKFIKDSDYPYFQVFSFVTKGVPKRNAKEFINAALSQRGREIIISKGMYPIFK